MVPPKTQTRRVPLLPSPVSSLRRITSFSPLMHAVHHFSISAPSFREISFKMEIRCYLPLSVYIPPLFSFRRVLSVNLSDPIFERNFPSTTTDDIPVNAKLLSCLQAAPPLSPRDLTIRKSETDNGLNDSQQTFCNMHFSLLK